MAGVVSINIIGNSSSAVAAIGRTNAALASLNGSAAAANAGISGIEKRFKNINKVFVGLAGGFVAAKAILSVADAASELEQSVGGVEAAFGSIKNGAEDMLALSAGANDAGLATAEFNQIAVELGSTLSNLGVAEAQVVDETSGLIELASDLAAAFGGGTQKAAAALTSALTGQSRPLKAYAITLRQVDVNARMAAEGISEAAARIAIIKEQSSSFAGQADREFGTYESTVNRLKAAFTDMQASLGKALLPALIAAANALKTFADVVSVIPDWVKSLGVKLLLAAGALKAFAVVIPKVVAGMKSLRMVMSASVFPYYTGQVGKSSAAMNKANASAAKLRGALKSVGVAALAVGVVYAFDAWKSALDDNVASADAYLKKLEEISDVADTLSMTPPDGAGDPTVWEQAFLGAAKYKDTLEAAKIAQTGFFDNLGASETETIPTLLAWANAGAAVESHLDAFEQLIEVDPRKAVAGWEEFRGQLESVGYSSERLEEISGIINELVESNSSLATASGEAASSAELQAAAYYTLADALSEAEEKQREYLEGVTYGPQNVRDFYSALKDAKKEAEGFSKVLDGKSFDNYSDGFKKLAQVAPEAQESLEGIADAAIDGAAGFMQLDPSGKQAAEAVKKARAQFIDAATALGYTTQHARDYADSLNLIPDNVPTNYEITGDDAYTIQKLKDGWTMVPREHTTFYKIKVSGYVPGKSDNFSTNRSTGRSMPNASALSAMANEESAMIMAAMSPAREALMTGSSTAELTLKVRVDAREMAGLADSWEDVTAAAERYEQTLDELVDKNKDIVSLQRELANADKDDRKGIKNELARAAKQAAGLAKELGIADINAKKLEKAVKGGGKNAAIALKLIADAGKQLKKAYREAEKAANKARQVFDSVKGLYDSVRGTFDSVFDTGELSQAIADSRVVPDNLKDAVDDANDSLSDYKKQVEDLQKDSRQFSYNPFVEAGWRAELDQATAGVTQFTNEVNAAQNAVDTYTGDAAGAVSATLDAQLREADLFNRQLNELVARGVDPAAINSLLNMGAEAGTELAGVLLNNPALLQKYQDTQNAIAEMGKAQADLQAQYQIDAIKAGIAEAAAWEKEYFKKNPLEIKTTLKIKLSRRQKRALRALGISPKDLTGRSAQSVTININAPQVDPEATALEISQRLRQMESRTQAPVFV